MNKFKISRKGSAVICMIFSAFCFALMNMFVKLSGDIPTMQKSFFRNAVAFAIALIMLLRQGGGFKPHKGCVPLLLGRSICGTIGIFCNFYALGRIVLSDASMLNKLSPFFAVLFSLVFLKEKLKAAQVVFVTTAFLGSLLIIKPEWGFLSESIPAIAGFMGGMAAGAAYTMVRALSAKGERGSYIVFFFSGFSCLASLPSLIFAYSPMTLKQLLFLILAGVSAAGGQFAITAAYSRAPAKEVSVYDYTQIIFAATLSYIVFDRPPDLFSYCGYAVITLSGVAMFLYNNRHKTDKVLKE